MDQKDTVIVAAPAGPTRDAVEAFVRAKGLQVASLRRESFPRTPRVVVDQTRLLLDDVDVLDRARAAIVLDSGLMWPLPMIDPTPDQWEQHREDFDTYLRDERETSSFWFSCLDIVGDRLKRCVNPQAAFALEATKLDAFEALREAGVPVAPTLCTNERDALDEFMAEHPGPWVEISLAGGPPTVVEAADLRARELDVDPVIVQVGDIRATAKVTSVQGAATAGAEPAVEGFGSSLAEAHRVLAAPWLDLWLRSDGTRWVLSDFSPSVKLDALPEAERERLIEAVWGWIDAGADR